MTTGRGVSVRVKLRKWYTTQERVVSLQNRTFTKDDALGLLLCRDVEVVNDYLNALTLQTFARYGGRFHIAPDELYVVITGDYDEPHSCILGEEILNPCFLLGTEDQIKDSFEWHKGMNTSESRHCDNLDSWMEFCLKMSLARIEWYRKIISQPRTPWLDIFLEEGKGAQQLLLEYHQKVLKDLRSKESSMKRSRAPEFMLQEQGEKVSHMKLIIRKLVDVISH